jgi:hypothetical protein
LIKHNSEFEPFYEKRVEYDPTVHNGWLKVSMTHEVSTKEGHVVNHEWVFSKMITDVVTWIPAWIERVEK